jgi:hypothetical protein
MASAIEQVSWDDFIRASTAYRDAEFTGRSPIEAEHAYLALVDELADVPIAMRGEHSASIVLFLNRWRCHFPTEESRAAIALWVPREAEALQALAHLSIFDQLDAHVAEVDRLFDSLITLRQGDPRISTMGDACASKLLHQMVPPLFVMWDQKIRRGYGSYGSFLLDMRRLALRLRDDLAPPEAHQDIELYLQRLLGYPVRKALAKFIDEFNWWRAWHLPVAGVAGE